MPRNAMIWGVTAAAVGLFSLISVDGARAQVMEENEVIQPIPEQQWECGVIDGSAEALRGGCTVGAGNCPRAWPGGVIPFSFDMDGLNHDFVRSAMDVWNLADAGIVFVPRTNEPNFVRFVSNDELVGGSSCVGMSGGSQDFEVHSTLWGVQPLLLHEMGHLLGQWHEHQRPDRNLFVTVIGGNIDPGAGGDMVPRNSCWLTMATGYDFLSILHYRSCQRSRCVDCPPFIAPLCNNGCVECGLTIVPTPGNEGFILSMGNQFGPSVLDTADMRNIYGSGVTTYVDRFASHFLANGTLLRPFPLFPSDVVLQMLPGGTLAVRGGTYTSPGVINKPMTIRSYLGPVTLTR